MLSAQVACVVCGRDSFIIILWRLHCLSWSKSFELGAESELILVSHYIIEYSVQIMLKIKRNSKGTKCLISNLMDLGVYGISLNLVVIVSTKKIIKIGIRKIYMMLYQFINYYSIKYKLNMF